MVIVRNNQNADGYFHCGCPDRVPSIDHNGDVIALNGMIFVSTTFGAFHPHYSFANLITMYPNLVAYVVNMDTGEMRYYDGTEAGDSDVKWGAEQRAIGKIKKDSVVNKRNLEVNKELGAMFASDIKALTHDIELNLDKVYCRKRHKYPLEPDIDSPTPNQFGFLGDGVLERDTLLKLVVPDVQDYYMVILYTLDKSGDVNHVADTKILPCVKFESASTDFENDKVSMINLQGKATYVYTLPFDYPNIEDYSPDGV